MVFWMSFVNLYPLPASKNWNRKYPSYFTPSNLIPLVCINGNSFHSFAATACFLLPTPRIPIWNVFNEILEQTYSPSGNYWFFYFPTFSHDAAYVWKLSSFSYSWQWNWHLYDITCFCRMD